MTDKLPLWLHVTIARGRLNWLTNITRVNQNFCGPCIGCEARVALREINVIYWYQPQLDEAAINVIAYIEKQKEGYFSEKTHTVSSGFEPGMHAWLARQSGALASTLPKHHHPGPSLARWFIESFFLHLLDKGSWACLGDSSPHMPRRSDFAMLAKQSLHILWSDSSKSNNSWG